MASILPASIRSFFFGHTETTSNSTTPKSEKTFSEDKRATLLLDAQEKAAVLFDEIRTTLLRPGVSESQLSKEIAQLAKERHNVKMHWHKKLVRAGANTLHPYKDVCPDRTVQADDILFVDLGPVFERWEADFGRTYVIGDDPIKQKLRDCLEPTWKTVKAKFDADPDMTGEQLYGIACEEAKKAGYEFGGQHSGHLVGDLPHEVIPDDNVTFYITKGSDGPMCSVDKYGNRRHWILEIHLVDREREIGGFFEQLLTVG